MDLTFLQTHRTSVEALCRQRQTLVEAPMADASTLERLERQLRLHLHVLARVDTPGEPPAEDAPLPAVFAALAPGLAAPAAERRQQALQQACELLTQGEAATEGALLALTFYPPADDEALLAVYRQQEPLRPRLFQLWRRQGRPLPAALTSQAELQGRSEALQAAALAYAASRPEVSLDVLRPYYQPLLSRLAPKVPGRVLAPAVWGALLRGEPALAQPLRRCIENEADSASRRELLRIGALSGDPALLPVLEGVLQREPVFGARLLALHGTVAAVDHLTDALGQAATMEAVATVWPWLTGQSPARQPRLQLVDGAAGEARKEMPAVAAARDWWRQRRPQLPAGCRLLAGEPMTTERLLALAGETAGERGRDLLDLLGLTLGRPVGVSDRAPILQRRQRLQQLRPAAAKGSPCSN